MLWGFVIGLPTAAIAGPIFARWAVRHVSAELLAPRRVQCRSLRRGFWSDPFTMLLPVSLMLLGTIAELAFEGAGARAAAAFIGNPTVALAISVLFALVARHTPDRRRPAACSEDSIASVGMTLLVVGGGGGFARVLREAASRSLGDMARAFHLPPLLYAWLVAAFIRVATGSAKSRSPPRRGARAAAR